MKRLEENAGAFDVKLDASDLEALDKAFPENATFGQRCAPVPSLPPCGVAAAATDGAARRVLCVIVG